MHFFVSSVTGKNKMVRSYNLIYDNFFHFFCWNFYNSSSLHFVTLRLFFVFDVRSSNNFPQNYCSLVTRKVAWDWTVNSYIKTRKKHTLGLQSCCAVQIFYFSYIYVCVSALCIWAVCESGGSLCYLSRNRVVLLWLWLRGQFCKYVAGIFDTKLLRRLLFMV